MTTRVCVFGMFDRQMSRNRLILDWLEMAGCEVDVCHTPGLSSRQRQGGAAPIRMIANGFRVCWAYMVLTSRFLFATPRPDLVLVLYPGHLVMPLAWALARVRGARLQFDIFISLYDTIVLDRRLVTPSSVVARIARLVDRWACRCADQILADTPDHARFFSKLTGVSPDKCRVLWVGADDHQFTPTPLPNGDTRVLFYGTFIPLHGLSTIIRAAKKLEDLPVEFRIIGRGQESEAIAALAEQLDVRNVTFIDWVPFAELSREIEQAHVCLGIFGTTDKAQRVVPNKVYQCVAAGRPVVTGDTPSVRAAFAVGEELEVSPCGDADALAEKLRAVLRDRPALAELAQRGRRRYENDYAAAASAKRLHQYVNEVLERAR